MVMRLSSDRFRNAALRHQWINHVTDLPLLPPLLNTLLFDDELYRSLLEKVENGPKNKIKSKNVRKLAPATYRAVRFDGKIRVMEFTHPGPYVVLVNTLSKNWGIIRSKLPSLHSTIKPKSHWPDPRVVIFSGRDYGKEFDLLFGIRLTANGKSRQSAAMRYMSGLRFINGTVLHLDVANFFPSIYTHSLDWVVTGKRLGNGAASRPGAEIDKAFQGARTARTDGVSIGPVTSSIAAELALSGVDEFLEEQIEAKRLLYFRAVDDFTILLRDGEDVTKFVNEMHLELSRVSLTLNSAKQRQYPYRDLFLNHIASIVAQLIQPLLPMTFKSSSRLFAELRAAARTQENSSVLKYGWKILRGESRGVNESLRWTFLHDSWKMLHESPHMAKEVVTETLDFADDEFNNIHSDYAEQLLEKFLGRGYTDVSCWLLYFLGKIDKSFDKALKTTGFYDWDETELRESWLDSFVALMILEFGEPQAVERLRCIFTDAAYFSDERTARWSDFWPIRYELFRRSLLSRSELDESGESEIFSEMKNHSFSLIS